ncbi:transposase [bacterium]|nr:transposase [bacterium]MCB2201518.1 transposase [bacterium]
MQNVHRYFQPGDTVFVTLVTQRRAPLLLSESSLLLNSIRYTEKALACRFDAWVIMPDHLHAVIQSDHETASHIVKRLKEKFTRAYYARRGMRSGRFWQSRFYDHIIRDEDDLRRHIDYTHYNPVKHGRTMDPFAWEHSSLGEFLSRGLYDRDWGVQETLLFEGQFGE